MKRTLLLLLTVGLAHLLSPVVAEAQAQPKSIQWQTIEKALELQKDDPKPIFIDLYTDWCGYCKRLDAHTFSNAEIISYMSSAFHAVKFNAEQKETVSYKGEKFSNDGSNRSTHQLAVALTGGKLSYPSLIFLDEKGDLITVVPGYYSPAQFEPILHFIGEGAYKSTSWEEFVKNFKGKL